MPRISWALRERPWGVGKATIARPTATAMAAVIHCFVDGPVTGGDGGAAGLGTLCVLIKETRSLSQSCRGWWNALLDRDRYGVGRDATQTDHNGYGVPRGYAQRHHGIHL